MMLLMTTKCINPTLRHNRLSNGWLTSITTVLGYTVQFFAPYSRHEYDHCVTITGISPFSGEHRVILTFKTREEARTAANAAYHLYSLSHPEDEEPEPQSCSLCDGYGHGYPGGGPCPLEERGADDGFEEWERSRGIVD